MKKLEGKFICSRCGKVYPWNVTVEKSKYCVSTEAFSHNCENYEKLPGKYVLELSCPICNQCDFHDYPIDE